MSVIKDSPMKAVNFLSWSLLLFQIDCCICKKEYYTAVKMHSSDLCINMDRS